MMPAMMEWLVTPTDPGVPLDFLAGKLPAAPRAYLRQLLRKGRVLGNQAPLGEATLLHPGDRIALTPSDRLRELLATAPTPQVVILYETREMLIVDKPAGLAAHRGQGHETDHLQGRIEALMRSRKASFTVAPVHRLDLETSGPVLFAKGRRAASRLGQLFMDGAVRKVYLALVAGELSGQGLLTAPVSAKGKLKEAVTGYRVLAADRELSLLELEPRSGRQHQIRQHLSAAGHPLAGDRRYGGPAPPGLERIFLHCRQLSLPDPFGGPPVAIIRPLAEDLAGFLRSYRPAWVATVDLRSETSGEYFT
jgi:RluA family pseudouridine synthase